MLLANAITTSFVAMKSICAFEPVCHSRASENHPEVDDCFLEDRVENGGRSRERRMLTETLGLVRVLEICAKTSGRIVQASAFVGSDDDFLPRGTRSVSAISVRDGLCGARWFSSAYFEEQLAGSGLSETRPPEAGRGGARRLLLRARRIWGGNGGLSAKNAFSRRAREAGEAR